MVLRQGLGLAATGVAIGVCVAMALSRMMTTLLYGVSAGAPLTFVAVAALLS